MKSRLPEERHATSSLSQDTDARFVQIAAPVEGLVARADRMLTSGRGTSIAVTEGRPVDTATHFGHNSDSRREWVAQTIDR